ncbi:MAG TPA: class I SAM-dependent methyltransferase [Candidatus Sulfotelmatobacter sp.]|jgi:SAM-dependent methyltransferase
MPLRNSAQPGIIRAASGYWRDLASRQGGFAATRSLCSALWDFLRDSTPERLKARFGDADYDWSFHVNTTSGAVGWRERLLGEFHSAYQPTQPGEFKEMLEIVAQHVDLPDFTFLDLGSGKGRTLLMASEYPFRRIAGVELLPALHEIGRENIARYKSESQKCFAIESICADATTFHLPEGPVVVYLFNPFPEAGLRRAAANITASLRENSRPMFVVYHNPQLEKVFADDPAWLKIAGTHQYSIFRATFPCS